MALKVLGVGSSMREGSYGTRALKIVLDRMEKLQAETHFMGQSTVVLDGERANGETYWIAHHVSESEGKRTLFIACIRYYDVFAKVDGKWPFAERKLIVDWTDTRAMGV